MLTYKNVIAEIVNVGEIKALIGVYEEIAALRMQEVRGAVTASVDYFLGLKNVSADVALDLSQAITQAPKREAAVFISAESGLYGDILDQILVQFVSFVKKNHLDAFVSGKMGAELLRMYAPEVKFAELPLPVDVDAVAPEILAKVMTTLAQYRQVTIFHARFQSLAFQTTVTSQISGAELGKSVGALTKEEIASIRLINIYEPELIPIAEKFTTEISASIVEQSVKENQLAKYAARLMHLDSALENAQNRLKSLNGVKTKLRKKIEQKKQTERISRLVCQRGKK